MEVQLPAGRNSIIGITDNSSRRGNLYKEWPSDISRL